MNRAEASAYILFLEASSTAEGGRPHAVICGNKRGLSSGGLRLSYSGIEMQQGLLHGEGVHLPVDAFPGLECVLQKMPGDSNSERISNDFRVALLIFAPRHQRECDPHGASVDQKLNIHGVCVTSGDSDN